MVIGSVQHLEYSISDALNKVTTVKQKTVAVIKGNGELQDVLMAKFLLQIRSYHIGPFTLDSVAKDPTGSLNALENMIWPLLPNRPKCSRMPKSRS
jgi:hypothetical protein